MFHAFADNQEPFGLLTLTSDALSQTKLWELTTLKKVIQSSIMATPLNLH